MASVAMLKFGAMDIYKIFERVFGLAYLLLNAGSYDGEIWHADAYRPRAGNVRGFYVYSSRRYENITFFRKYGAMTSDRSVQAVILYQSAGWLASAARWLATAT